MTKAAPPLASSLMSKERSTRRALFSMVPPALAAATIAPRVLGNEPARPLQPDIEIDLWPGGAPGDLDLLRQEVITERASQGEQPDRAIHGISRPRLALFRPRLSNGAAVLIMPGSGYQRVVVDREGYEMAHWLRNRGFAAFVLFYRLPAEGWADSANVPLADAQRAMRKIRAMAGGNSFDSQRVAVIGFSAGGHLCADLAARFARSCYIAVDACDDLSARPFRAAPIYPVVSMDATIAHMGSRNRLLGPSPTDVAVAAHSPDLTTPDDAPPHFLVHAEDDPTVSIENSIALRTALKRKRVPVESHFFSAGGHGFGLRDTVGHTTQAWPNLWLQWATIAGLASTS